MKQNEAGKAQALMPGIKIGEAPCRQSLPTIYRLNGVVEVIRTKILLGQKNMYGSDIQLYEVEESKAVDIDTPFDFEICELLLSKDH